MTDSTPAPKRATLRLWLAMTLILPLPLLWETATAYATRDYYNAPHWLGGILIHSVLLLNVIGVMLLPLKIWPRIALTVLIVPMAVLVEAYWGFTYVCAQFGDCL